MKIMKAAVRFLIALVMGLIYMWFLLSFKWSLDDMSTIEKVVGIVYGARLLQTDRGDEVALTKQHTEHRTTE